MRIDIFTGHGRVPEHESITHEHTPVVCPEKTEKQWTLIWLMIVAAFVIGATNGERHAIRLLDSPDTASVVFVVLGAILASAVAWLWFACIHRWRLTIPPPPGLALKELGPWLLKLAGVLGSTWLVLSAGWFAGLYVSMHAQMVPMEPWCFLRDLRFMVSDQACLWTESMKDGVFICFFVSAAIGYFFARHVHAEEHYPADRSRTAGVSIHEVVSAACLLILIAAVLVVWVGISAARAGRKSFGMPDDVYSTWESHPGLQAAILFGCLVLTLLVVLLSSDILRHTLLRTYRRGVENLERAWATSGTLDTHHYDAADEILDEVIELAIASARESAAKIQGRRGPVVLKLLDVGSGPGLTLFRLPSIVKNVTEANMKIRYVGVEPEQKAVEAANLLLNDDIAKKYLGMELAGPTPRTHKIGLNQLVVKDKVGNQEFDLILVHQTIQFLEIAGERKNGKSPSLRERLADLFDGTGDWGCLLVIDEFPQTWGYEAKSAERSEGLAAMFGLLVKPFSTDVLIEEARNAGWTHMKTLRKHLPKRAYPHPDPITGVLFAKKPQMVCAAGLLSEPQERVFDLLSKAWALRLLEVVVDHELLEKVRGEVKKVGQLAEEIGWSPDVMNRVAEFLDSVEVLAKHEDVVELGRVGWALAGKGSAGLSYWVKMYGREWHAACRSHLDEALKTGEARLFAHEGNQIKLYEYLQSNTADGDLFDTCMEAHTHSVFMKASRSKYWGGKSIVDAGGSSGALAEAILKGHDDAKVAVLDIRKGAVDRATPRLASFGTRGKALEHDIWTGLPQSYDGWDGAGSVDAVVLAFVLHNLNDEDAEKLVRIFAGAVQKCTELVLIEYDKSDKKHLHDWARVLDMSILAMFGGRERSLEEYRNLLGGCGFSPQDPKQAARLPGGAFMLTAKKTKTPGLM